MRWRRRYRTPAIAVAVLAAVATAAYHFGRGHRYRLYTDTWAGDCWRAVELTTLSSSSLDPVSVGAPIREADGRTRVSIDYTMDRVLGGKTLNVACTFSAGDPRLASVEFDGIVLDAAEIARVNRELEDRRRARAQP